MRSFTIKIPKGLPDKIFKRNNKYLSALIRNRNTGGGNIGVTD